MNLISKNGKLKTNYMIMGSNLKPRSNLDRREVEGRKKYSITQKSNPRLSTTLTAWPQQK